MTSGVDCDSLSKSALARELDRAECEVLQSIIGVRDLTDGELLVSEGDAVSTLFMLIDGEVSVLGKPQGEEKEVYRMKPGDVAGTRAFVDRTPRQATLRAVGPATVYTLEPGPFESLIETHPRVVYKIMRGLFCITHTNLMRMNVESRELSGYIYRSGRRY